MRINILNECKNCVHHGLCKMENDREISIRTITGSHSADENDNFIMDLSCKYYIWCNFDSIARCENRRLGDED